MVLEPMLRQIHVELEALATVPARHRGAHQGMLRTLVLQVVKLVRKQYLAREAEVLPVIVLKHKH